MLLDTRLGRSSLIPDCEMSVPSVTSMGRPLRMETIGENCQFPRTRPTNPLPLAGLIATSEVFICWRRSKPQFPWSPATVIRVLVCVGCRELTPEIHIADAMRPCVVGQEGEVLREPVLKRKQHGVVVGIAALVGEGVLGVSYPVRRILQIQPSSQVGTGAGAVVHRGIHVFWSPYVGCLIAEIGGRCHPITAKLPLIAQAPLQHISGLHIQRKPDVRSGIGEAVGFRDGRGQRKRNASRISLPRDS